MIALRRTLTSPGFATATPYLALLLGMVSLAIGTSYAKQLFPVIGAEGTSTLRVGLSALVLVAIWRPWRFRLTPRRPAAASSPSTPSGVSSCC